MATYLIIGEYSKTAFHGMLTDATQSCDREAAAKALFESIHIKLVNIFYSISTGSIVCIVEGSAKKFAEICMITMASGAFQKIHTEELMSVSAMNDVIHQSKKKCKEFKESKRS